MYLITNKKTGRRYLGKKQYWHTRKGKNTHQTDWEWYTGSSNEVNRDIRNLGLNQFKFEILCQAPSRGALRYLETNIQHKKDVLLDYTNWYNKRIDGTFPPSAKERDDIKKLIRNVM